MVYVRAARCDNVEVVEFLLDKASDLLLMALLL